MEARFCSSDPVCGGNALATILPPGVSVATSRRDVVAPLFPQEEAAIARAVEARRREFATGRACARAALGRLGVLAEAIPVGPGGMPRWPPGIVGSITHCEGFRACAVACRDDVLAIGIDAEPNRPLGERVCATVAGHVELALIDRLARTDPGIHWDRLLFSAKETVFKAWFPLCERSLGFDDVRLAVDPLAGTFSAQIRVPDPPAEDDPRVLSGRWVLDDDLILTVIAVPGHLPASSLLARR